MINKYMINIYVTTHSNENFNLPLPLRYKLDTDEFYLEVVKREIQLLGQNGFWDNNTFYPPGNIKYIRY